MRFRALTAILITAIGCSSGQAGEVTPPEPGAIAGTWEYRLSDAQHVTGSIFISPDTSENSYNEVTFDNIGMVRTYEGILRRLLDVGAFVCWTDETQQIGGLELTVHSGRLLVTYFDECRGAIRRSPAYAQRSVRHCKHTLLQLRRTAPP